MTKLANILLLVSKRCLPSFLLFKCLVIVERVSVVYGYQTTIIIVLFLIYTGLLLAGLMVELFQYPQPALLYLVPCVLIPLFSKSYIQGQLSILWKGPVFTNNNNALPVINSKLPV